MFQGNAICSRECDIFQGISRGGPGNGAVGPGSQAGACHAVAAFVQGQRPIQAVQAPDLVHASVQQLSLLCRSAPVRETYKVPGPNSSHGHIAQALPRAVPHSLLAIHRSDLRRRRPVPLFLSRPAPRRPPCPLSPSVPSTPPFSTAPKTSASRSAPSGPHSKARSKSPWQPPASVAVTVCRFSLPLTRSTRPRTELRPLSVLSALLSPWSQRRLRPPSSPRPRP